ncbi:tol-pal system protein YbgF [Rhodoferax sp.]|uniref:tol-pal system protein YbgF n=1 Tax=Rhodoferax sp. TaxID=50421 RepID=UPI0026383BB8|nr:tol-pal system protein YbgF [Rhodoferax sp.]MDD5479714.1 tol-pal system protein YbgF [Rhodoferax sp.]
MQLKLRAVVFLLGCAWVANAAQAALFEDDEARKAILDLRQRVEAMRQDTDQSLKSTQEEKDALGRGLLDLQRQMEQLKTSVAALRGENEKLLRDLSDLQRSQKDQAQVLNERLAQFEPVKVQVDGIEFLADPAEKRDFENALAVFKKGDFVNAQNALVGFVGRYPLSQYVPSALFWLGNAQYASRDYKEAIINFRALISRNPDHLRTPEAVLSVANCQLELKDSKGARKTLTDLIKAYPQSEAALAAKERLTSLK